MTQKIGRIAVAILATMISGAAYAQDHSVKIVLSEELENLDPCNAAQSNIGRVVLENIAETLTEMVPGKGLEPRLATSWENMGGGTWRFHLRKDVKFSDGEPFGAKDVVFSLERNKSKKLVCQTGAKFYGGMKFTTKIVDDHTVDITSDPAQPILPLIMSTLTIMPASSNPDAFVKKPIGTGPYVFEEYKRGQDIKLKANPNYWGPKPAVTEATYVFRSDSAVRAAMVKTGEADIAPNIALQDATDPKMDFSYPNSETVYMRLDTNEAPLNDIRVREALNYAVDRKSFIGTILAKGTLLATGMTPPSTIGYNHDLKPWPYDPAKAKALLAQAKAAGVDTGAQINVIGRIDNFANVTETMEALIQMWKDVGFNVKLHMMQVAEWNQHYSKPFAKDRGPEIVEAMHDNANGDPVFSMYFKYASGGVQSAVTDPKLDKMIADATAATGETRVKDWEATFKYVQDQAYTVMLWHMVGFTRVNPRLNFTPTIKTNSELQLSQIKFR